MEDSVHLRISASEELILLMNSWTILKFKAEEVIYIPDKHSVLE
jgi:hypothetical protein